MDLSISEGAVYGLIGPNGAGKTTLIRMLATVEDPTRGEIFLFGERLLAGEDNLQIKRRLGYLPDDYPLYDNMNVGDYLDYFARLYQFRKHRIDTVLELVQLTSKRKSQIKSLSRGMRQRLSLARTIIHEPLLLLLDEPVSGLDPIARHQFREILKVLNSAGMTILISSHVLSYLAECCTEIGILELGSLVESTTLADLYARQSQQTLVISLLAGEDEFKTCLQQCEHVREWDVEPKGTSKQYQVTFSGEEAEIAQFLKTLIYAGCSISEFSCQSEDLESIFLKLGHQQVS